MTVLEYGVDVVPIRNKADGRPSLVWRRSSVELYGTYVNSIDPVLWAVSIQAILITDYVVGCLLPAVYRCKHDAWIIHDGDNLPPGVHLWEVR